MIMNDIFLRQIKMPLSIRAFTILDSNDDYNVYLNADLSEEAKQISYNHELQHIKNNDFYSGLSVEEIEKALLKKAR